MALPRCDFSLVILISPTQGSQQLSFVICSPSTSTSTDRVCHKKFFFGRVPGLFLDASSPQILQAADEYHAAGSCLLPVLRCAPRIAFYVRQPFLEVKWVSG